MKNRFYPLLLVCVLILNAVGATFADTKVNNKNQTNQLVALLPASDAVLTFDAKRFIGDALPQILSGNQTLLGKIFAHVDEIKNKTGIDLRRFEQVAVGATAKRITPKEYDIEPVVLARGTNINAAALLSAAKLAANGKYREEKVGGKSVFVFAAKEIAAANKPQNTSAGNNQMIDKFIGKLSSEIAVSAFDSNTLAFGTAARVRQTLEAKTRVGADVSGLLSRNPDSVMNFSAKLPDGMSAFLPLDNDELGKNIDSIQYLSGMMNVAGDRAALQLMAKTQNDMQAQGLLDTLNGLQLVLPALLGSASGADKQVYRRLIENAKFSRKTNEVTFDLQVQQSDINVLIGGIK